MPPQQAYGLLDFVNQRLDFRAHGQIVPSISFYLIEKPNRSLRGSGFPAWTDSPSAADHSEHAAQCKG
jgi:hypothetical protein